MESDTDSAAVESEKQSLSSTNYPGFDEKYLDLDVETKLAKELNELSIKERERVYFDLHGVGEVVDESPESIALSLEQLEASIAQKRDTNAAYA